MRLLPLIFTTTFLVGSVYGDVSMDAQIEQIMNAPANERVGLMNQLKTKLAGMNENERKEALQKLQNGMDRGIGKGSQSHLSPMPMQHMNGSGSTQRQMNAHTQPNFSNRH